MQKLFRYPKTFSTLKGFPRKLLALWDKKFSREKRDTTIMRNFSRYHIFSETVQRLTRSFSSLWDQIFSTEKCFTPNFSSVKTLRNQNFSRKQKDSFTKIFGTVRRTIFGGNVWPHLCIKFFADPKLSETLKGCLQSLRHCQTWLFRQKNVYTPNMQKNFRYHNFSERVQGWTRNFSSLWDENFSTEKSYTPPPPFHP